MINKCPFKRFSIQFSAFKTTYNQKKLFQSNGIISNCNLLSTEKELHFCIQNSSFEYFELFKFATYYRTRYIFYVPLVFRKFCLHISLPPDFQVHLLYLTSWVMQFLIFLCHYNKIQFSIHKMLPVLLSFSVIFSVLNTLIILHCIHGYDILCPIIFWNTLFYKNLIDFPLSFNIITYNM